MDIKKARSELDKKPSKFSTDQIEKDLDTNGQTFVYLDRDNPAKDIKKLYDYFTNKGCNVHYSEIHYGLDESDYLYEMHIIAPSFAS